MLTIRSIACSRLSVVGDKWKQARKKRLRRGAVGEPVRISLTTLFWYSRSCYTLWLVNFDSTVNTPVVASYLVNQKDGEHGLCERLQGIQIDFHLGRLSAGFPKYSSAKEGAATMSSNSSLWERRFCYSSNWFWEKLIFQLLPQLAKAAMKSEMCSIVVVSPLVSVMWDQVEQLKQLGFSVAKNMRKTRKQREKGSVTGL